MVSVQRIFAVSIMASIILFGLIHVGVSIGIIIPARNFGAIYRPQIGLCSFDLTIALLALVTGTLGLVMLILGNDRLCKVVAILAGVLAIFSLASLVTALIINAKSLSYVGGRFQDYMMEYQYSSYARNIVDKIQTEGQCCGENIWIDWSSADFNSNTTNPNSTSATITPTTTSTTTTSTATSTVTTSITTSTTTTSVTTSTTTTPSTSSVTNPTTNADSSIISTSTSTTQSLSERKSLNPSISSKQIKQGDGTYGGISGLPLSFSIILPGSCCTSEATFINGTTQEYCKSSMNGVANHFNSIGCAKGIGFTAGNQTMGVGVINSFLVVLALAAIGILMNSPSSWS